MKNTRYEELFPDKQSKADAFDKIAEKFYDSNFGQMSKGDLEVLMFHLYIERILKQGDRDFREYSDYKLSKDLGVPETKIRTLKVKKQLQYPHKFNWAESLAAVSGNAQYENGKIKIQIPDINLFNEIKNVVEEMGGYVDITLTPRLLQISPGYFLDLLVMAEDENDREELRKRLRDKIRKDNKDLEYLEEESFGKQLGKIGRDITVSTVSNVLSDLVEDANISMRVSTLARNIWKELRNKINNGDK